MSLEVALKSRYVAAARGAGRVAERSGLGDWLDARTGRSRTAHWLRSLTAIHDLDAMIRLDVPWWTYRAIDVVEAFLYARPGARIFEYGSGASTVWLARRAARVTSVEHDAGWHDRMVTALAERSHGALVDLRLVPADLEPEPDPLYRSAKATAAGASFATYARSIDAADTHYDVIVVDGRARPACLGYAIRHLAPGGMIVFDNSHRARYREAIVSSGLAARRFRGLAPALPYLDETTLLVDSRR